MPEYDIIIIGASFAGLALAHRLPRELRVLIIDRKGALDAAVESTGLITSATKDILAEFVDVEKFLPNRITTIGVVSPDYDKHFFSYLDQPWIYSTDTPKLLRAMSESLPDNVKLLLNSSLVDYTITDGAKVPVTLRYLTEGAEQEVAAKFLVGADGGRSAVAARHPRLSKNKKFLVGLEKVFYGTIDFGPRPDATVYHFWFGEFSLGYGGWLSPTIINGRAAFRLGLAKLANDYQDMKILDEFVDVLKNRKIITFTPQVETQDFASLPVDCQPIHSFGQYIPIGGVLKKITDNHVLLVGDAAGFCGAFAADGIKGALLSGQVAARLIPRYLNGERRVLNRYKKEIQTHNHLLTYYFKQRLYRILWNLMRSNRSFHALYDLIARDKESFLLQFCDSRDKRKSLTSIVLKWGNVRLLVSYAWAMVRDLSTGL